MIQLFFAKYLNRGQIYLNKYSDKIPENIIVQAVFQAVPTEIKVL